MVLIKCTLTTSGSLGRVGAALCGRPNVCDNHSQGQPHGVASTWPNTHQFVWGLCQSIRLGSPFSAGQVGTETARRINVHGRPVFQQPTSLLLDSKKGFLYNKAGVILGDLVPEDKVQANFLDKIDRQKARRLMRALDTVNVKLPDSRLIWAAEGIDQAWRTKFTRRSKRYTTQWNELVEVP